MSNVITDDEAKTIIGENVSRLLNARGWKQSQLAEATGENEMTISRVVRGLHVPGAGLLSRLAEVLQTTADELLKSPQKKSRRSA